MVQKLPLRRKPRAAAGQWSFGTEWAADIHPTGKPVFTARQLDIVAHELAFEPQGLRQKLKELGMTFEAAGKMHNGIDRMIAQRRGLGQAKREQLVQERDFLAELLRRHRPEHR